MVTSTAADRVDPIAEVGRTGRHPALPTGWGRWPTCACPPETRDAAEHRCCRPAPHHATADGRRAP
jgi:hypothetical protein